MVALAPAKAPQPLTSSPYPFAAAPDIIRAHQKDAYFQGLLTNQVNDLHRRLRGARSAHAWATETRTFADLLYLSLTTLLGNRTLGEEYCDLVQVEEPLSSPLATKLHLTSASSSASPDNQGGPRLPSLQRRAGYIATSIILPYLFGRLLPSIRASLRKRLQDRLTALARQGKGGSINNNPSNNSKSKNQAPQAPALSYRVQRYLLTHLTTLTSGTHFQAVALAVFYFTGAYYSFSKRLFGLRYVFTRQVDDGAPGGGRAGYEVLGVLLVLQMLVRGYTHLRHQVSLHSAGHDDESASVDLLIRERAFGPAASAGTDLSVSLDDYAYSSNNDLLIGSGVAGGGGNQRSLVDIGATTHTPVVKGGSGSRYDLAAGPDEMAWIKGYQQRKCTLCLEELRDPAATSCGHVFCWACIGDWVREKPECPLCRREALIQHILPLRVA